MLTGKTGELAKTNQQLHRSVCGKKLIEAKLIKSRFLM